MPRLGSSQLVSRWIVATLAISIFSVLDGGFLWRWAALAPHDVFRGQLWRLVTWSLIEPTPLSLVLTCVVIYKLGGELAIRWGDRRLRRFVLHIVVGAGIATCLLAALFGARHLHRVGGWAISEAIVIAWARQFPNAPLVLYGLLVVRGQQLVRITVAFAILMALYYGPINMAPELFATAAAALYPREWLR